MLGHASLAEIRTSKATSLKNCTYARGIPWHKNVAHAKVANEDAIKRAELRQVRPQRGPFNVGDWVFYYDQKGQGKRPESVINWRGVARVIGHEVSDPDKNKASPKIA